MILEMGGRINENYNMTIKQNKQNNQNKPTRVKNNNLNNNLNNKLNNNLCESTKSFDNFNTMTTFVNYSDKFKNFVSFPKKINPKFAPDLNFSNNNRNLTKKFQSLKADSSLKLRTNLNALNLTRNVFKSEASVRSYKSDRSRSKNLNKDIFDAEVFEKKSEMLKTINTLLTNVNKSCITKTDSNLEEENAHAMYENGSNTRNLEYRKANYTTKVNYLTKTIWKDEFVMDKSNRSGKLPPLVISKDFSYGKKSTSKNMLIKNYDEQREILFDPNKYSKVMAHRSIFCCNNN